MAVYIVFAIGVVAFLLAYLASGVALAWTRLQQGHSWGMAVAGLGRESAPSMRAARMPVRGAGALDYGKPLDSPAMTALPYRWTASEQPVTPNSEPYAPLVAGSWARRP